MARTNIDLDEELVTEGLKVTGCRTRKALVNLALEELVKRKKRKKILDLEGKIRWEGDLDEMRQGRT
ncbi:MAG: type II toxin-antitoxin system VapB family antitoxin [Chloroflexi bacterium]|nr:type II toxin-antitoxin system VapB family antitoxin [Chloroflexota bacterium]